MAELANGFDASIVDEKALKFGPAGIDIAYQRLGEREAPAVLLIMGIAAQSIAWPDAFCHALVDRGLQVIRFDNRDAGLSTHMTEAPPPNLPAVLGGDLSSVSYTLSDMAGDAVGLLDVLGFKKAHVVGASMGGAIAQTMAIEHPGRVRSLISMMSTTGNMAVGQVSPEVRSELFSGPPAVTRDDVIQQTLRVLRTVGSTGYPNDEKEAVARAARAYDRCYDPTGIARQAIASVASGDRTERLQHLDVPTLVIHGLADRMCDVSGGRATSEAIPGSELVLMEEWDITYRPVCGPNSPRASPSLCGARSVEEKQLMELDEKQEPCVLVVDDDSVNRAQWNNAFDRAGFRVMETSSRTDALKYLDDADSEIYLLVIGIMSDAEGALLVAHVAEQRPTFPFIVIASAANPVGIQSHFAILLEPVSDKDLIETAQVLLSK